MRALPHTVLALALSMSLCALPAFAQTESLRAEVAKPLQAAQEAIKAGRGADALARVREAEAVASRSPFEVFTTDRMKGSAAMLAGDSATALQAFSSVVQAGRLSGPDLMWVLQALPGLALDRKSTRLNSSHSQQSRMPSSA